MTFQPALPPRAALEVPRIIQPAPFETSFGHIVATVPKESTTVQVFVNGKAVASTMPEGRTRVAIEVNLPLGDSTLRVVALTSSGAARRSRTVSPVFGLPLTARPLVNTSSLDTKLETKVVPLTRRFPSAASAYVRNLRTGAGAAWNARARFPAASSLKLAIAVETLRTIRGPPPHGGDVDALLRAAIISSDNEAADRLEVLVGGSTFGGSTRVNALLRALGLTNTDMYGGYELESPAARPIPVAVNDQPSISRTKYSTAFDLAQLMADVYLAAEGTGPLLRRVHGFDSEAARYLLYLLLHVTDHGKIDRFLPHSVAVAHKAGWNSVARVDNGLVIWNGGVFVETVMTWSPSGIGTSSDVLAGRVAQLSFDRFRTEADN